MTMLVAPLGLLPAATSHGIGSDSQRPFAIVIVGGLMGALVMSIYLLPSLYVWIAGDHDKPAAAGSNLGGSRLKQRGARCDTIDPIWKLSVDAPYSPWPPLRLSLSAQKNFP